MAKFMDFLENSGYPTYEWGVAYALMFFARRRTRRLLSIDIAKFF